MDVTLELTIVDWTGGHNRKLVYGISGSNFIALCSEHVMFEPPTPSDLFITSVSYDVSLDKTTCRLTPVGAFSELPVEDPRSMDYTVAAYIASGFSLVP